MGGDASREKRAADVHASEDYETVLDKCWVGTRLMRNEPQTCTPQRMLGGDASREIPYGSLWKYPETLRELGLTISLHRAPGNQW